MRKVGWVGAIAVCLVLAACSSGTDKAAAKAADSASGKAGVAAAKAQIEKYSAEPKFKTPGKPIDVSKLRGTKIENIPVSSTIPFCNATGQKMASLAKAASLNFKSYTNQGQLSQWVQGFQAASSARANVVNIFCGLDAEKVAPQVKQTVKSGTPVVAAHTYATGQKKLPALTGVVYGAYIKAAKLMADYTIADTKGTANVLVLTSPSTSNSPLMEKAIKAEFADKCPGCKVAYFGVNVPDWSKSIDPKVRAVINSNPSLNYVMPIYDGMVPFVTPAITATGATDQVHVASFNATPSVLDQIRDGKTVRFEVGEDPAWLAGAILDQDMRTLLKMPQIKNYQAGVRVFTKNNVKDAGVPAKIGAGYGTSASEGYRKLWGLG